MSDRASALRTDMFILVVVQKDDPSTVNTDLGVTTWANGYIHFVFCANDALSLANSCDLGQLVNGKKWWRSLRLLRRGVVPPFVFLFFFCRGVDEFAFVVPSHAANTDIERASWCGTVDFLGGCHTADCCLNHCSEG